MFLVDTHAHLDLSIFDHDIYEVIQRSCTLGIQKICIPNINSTSFLDINILCNNFHNICFPMIGLHPTSINTFYKNDLRIIRKELNKRKYIAIGEIGIDYFKNKIYAKEQIKAFEEQLHWSIEFDLPIVIHAREAFLEVFESLYKIGLNKLCGVFHSFNGNLENLKEILKYKNFMFGVNGLITHKNNEFQKHLYIVPIEKILLETDSPYLTPIPFRGRRNEPSYIIHIAQKIATIYNMPVEIIAKITTCNALNLFKI